MEKYFYCRADSTLTNDDDNANGSCLVKVSDLISMGSTANGSLALRFKPRMNAFSGGEAANVDYKTDSITLTVSDNTQKTIIERILAEVQKPQIAGAPYFITLYDAVTGDGIKGVTAVSVAIAAAQA